MTEKANIQALPIDTLQTLFGYLECDKEKLREVCKRYHSLIPPFQFTTTFYVASYVPFDIISRSPDVLKNSKTIYFGSRTTILDVIKTLKLNELRKMCCVNSKKKSIAIVERSTKVVEVKNGKLVILPVYDDTNELPVVLRIYHFDKTLHVGFVKKTQRVSICNFNGLDDECLYERHSNVEGGVLLFDYIGK